MVGGRWLVGSGWWFVALLLERKWIEEPADQQAGANEPGEEAPAEEQLIPGLVAQEGGEHYRDERREQRHQAEVRGHFRPSATSHASRTTSMFSSPATMAKALPYS